MDKKSKLFLALFFLLIIAMVGVTYYKIIILRDYQIAAQAECDPTLEKCFIYECSPEDDEECSDNPAERLSYYKIIHKQAYNFPECRAGEECEEPKCEPGEEKCEEILCREAELKDDEACSDPASFSVEAEAEEEEAENEETENENAACAPEDEACGIEDAAAPSEESESEPVLQ